MTYAAYAGAQPETYRSLTTDAGFAVQRKDRDWVLSPHGRTSHA